MSTSRRCRHLVTYMSTGCTHFKSMQLEYLLMLLVWTALYPYSKHYNINKWVFDPSGRTYKMLLCRDISWVQRMSEIALHKNNECVLQPGVVKHELVHVFIPYYP